MRNHTVLLGLICIVAPGQAGADPRAVVELFTSQGCSPCVSADALMAKLAARDDVIPLSFHVDYWDYLGWRDTFGLPESYERQRGYAAVRGSRRIFTPQMIVNGTADMVGSDHKALEHALARASLTAPVSIVRENGTLTIEVGARALGGSRPNPIRLISLSSVENVEITRGENAGSRGRYHNVVRAIRTVGMWDGTIVKISLPENEILSDEVDGYAVIVQEDRRGGPGAILGAAQLSNLRPLARRD